MSDNGGGGGGGRRRTARATTSKRKTKKLGYVAQASIAHNDELVEEFIRDIRAGRATPYEMAVVEAEGGGRSEFGGGVFSIKLPNGSYRRAVLRGLLKGRGRFHHNPNAITAVKPGAHVLVEDLGLGGRTSSITHQIMGVMMYDQYLRATAGGGTAKRSSSRKSSSNRGGFEFNRGLAAALSAIHREATMANLNLIKAKERARTHGGAGAAASKHSDE